MSGNETPEHVLQPVLAQMQANDEQALASLSELARLYPEDARLPFLAGSMLAGLERYIEARSAMQKAVQIAPGYALARFQLGLLELSSGDAVAAQAIWQPLLGLPSEDPLNLFVRGLQKMIGDDVPQAIALLEEGIARNTKLPLMNRDMNLVIAKMRETPPGASGQDVESDAHFLLKQYRFKDTKH